MQVHSLRLPSYVIACEAIFGAPDERLTIRHDAGASAAALCRRDASGRPQGWRPGWPHPGPRHPDLTGTRPGRYDPARQGRLWPPHGVFQRDPRKTLGNAFPGFLSAVPEGAAEEGA